MRILFLDDDLNRIKHFLRVMPDSYHILIVETAESAIKALKEHKFDHVFLDHDLGGEAWVNSSRPDTGMEVVRWLCDNITEIGTVHVHSHNHHAAPVMAKKLSGCGYNATYKPFAERYPGYNGS